LIAGFALAVLTAAAAGAQTASPPSATPGAQGDEPAAAISQRQPAPSGYEPSPNLRRGRFELHNASFAFGYSSLGIGNSSVDPALARLTADYYAITSTTAGYSSSGTRGGTTLTYSPVYVRRFRLSDLSSLNHLLAFSTRRQATLRNWLSFSLSGSAASAEQIAFNSSQAGRLAGANATALELSEVLLGQHQSNNDVAHIAATAGSDPLALAIFGGRVLSASANVGHEWTPSARTSVRSSLLITRSQGLGDSGTAAQGLNLRSSGGVASWGITYNLSPRTTTGASVAYSKARSSWMNNDTTSAEYSLGRRLSSRWFSNVSGGIGRVSLVGLGPEHRPGTLTFSGSGSLGFRSRIHSLVGSYSRRAGDAYGVGAGSTSIAQVSLSTARPGRSWSTFTGASWQAMQQSIFGSIRTWQVQGGYTQFLGSHVSISTSIAYMDITNPSAPGLDTALSGYHARVVMSWRPGDGERR
jgi:hypothetical protein